MGNLEYVNQFSRILARVVKVNFYFTTWSFKIGIDHKISTSGVEVMALESWGKNLEVILVVSYVSVCGVFNIYNFLKIYLMVGLGCCV